MEMDSDDFCWICLDDVSKGQLINPCRCPRKVHPTCLARWQLQQAGRAEETQCRFCNSQLADWKASLTPEPLKPEVERVQPIMVVYFEGEIHRIPVRQGNEGLSDFTTRIRELFRLPEDVDISLTFGCKEPMSGQHLKLEGIGAFDAAVHCASVAAAERQHKLRSTGGGSGVPSGGSAGGTVAPQPHGCTAATASPQPSGGGASSSGGSTVSSASAPSAAPPTAHQQRTQGSNHLGTTYLRHSTGSSWPASLEGSTTTAASASSGASSPALSPQATVAHALDDRDLRGSYAGQQLQGSYHEGQYDQRQGYSGHHQHGGALADPPSPFSQGLSAWMYSNGVTVVGGVGGVGGVDAGAVPLNAPLLMDEQLLLQQHLSQLSQAYYSPAGHYPGSVGAATGGVMGASEAHLHMHTAQEAQRSAHFAGHGSLDLLAPSTPTHTMGDVHAPHASPLPSLLSAPSLSRRVASRLPGTLHHGAGGLSADDMLAAAAAYGSPGAAGAGAGRHQHPGYAHGQGLGYPTGDDAGEEEMQHACEPSSPSVSMDGASGSDEHAHAHAHYQGGLQSGAAAAAAMASRRARRSSGNAAPLPPAPRHHRHGAAADAGVEAEGEGEGESGGCMEYSDAASAEAMAWAASFTGRLRCSLKALSRKFVRTINTGLFNHHQHHHHQGHHQHQLGSQGASSGSVGHEERDGGSSDGRADGQQEEDGEGQGQGQEAIEEQRYRLHQEVLRYSAIPAVHQRQYVLAYQQQQQQQQAAARRAMGH